MASERVWLNDKPHLSAYVSWEVKPDDENVDASLRISDCNRVVVLDFDTYGKESARDRLRKANRLLRSVQRFRDALIAEIGE